MAEKEKNDALEDVKITELNELTDDDLDDVAGGIDDNGNCGNTQCCGGGSGAEERFA